MLLIIEQEVCKIFHSLKYRAHKKCFSSERMRKTGFGVTTLHHELRNSGFVSGAAQLGRSGCFCPGISHGKQAHYFP